MLSQQDYRAGALNWEGDVSLCFAYLPCGPRNFLIYPLYIYFFYLKMDVIIQNDIC